MALLQTPETDHQLMGLWMRIFARSEAVIDPVLLAEKVAQWLPGTTCHFGADGAGWFHLEIRPPSGGPIQLDRYHCEEEGLRRDLNTWAAWVETCDYCPDAPNLMERVIQSRQFFTVMRSLDTPDESGVDRLCEGLCQYLSTELDGIWQADGQGLKGADGTLLLQEY